MIGDTPVPGLQTTTGRPDAREKPLARIADGLLGRLTSAQVGNGAAVTPPRKVTTRKSARPPSRKRSSGSLVLLGELLPEEVCFRRVEDVTTVHLRPRNGEELVRSQMLKTSADQGAVGWGRLPFAYDLDGTWVHAQNVAYEGEGGRRRTIVTLRTARYVRQGFSFGQDAPG
ncbi:hypothetical protein V3W47_19120 [Deinococcus sp. YIM 134068]|uniref:hypothetical protein n=1 Tax=Deinococcus lichenicola TaxID=3118910 RepID=UPI002F9210FE